jgi:amino acid adenylation domain-containing protein
MEEGTTRVQPQPLRELSLEDRLQLEQRLVRPRSARAESSIPRRDRRLPCPLSFSQQRLWFLEKFDPGHRYNVPFALRLRGPLNLDALRQALNGVLARHEVLRTRFPTVDGGPVQEVLESATLDLPVTDLGHQPEAEREANMLRLLAEAATQPFDLATDLMVRALIVRMGPDHHCLLVAMHHIVCDAWSMGVFASELTRLYEALCNSAPAALRELPVQYGDFALWQRNRLQGEVLQEQVRYWGEHLAGAPSVLELPTDRPRSLLPASRSGQQEISLSADLVEAVQALARQERATVFIILMAVFQVLVARWCGQKDVVVGTIVAGRPHSDVEPLIGLFINTLALRARLEDNPTFREVLRQARGAILEGMQHQELPFEKLVEELNVPRNVGTNPLFQVLFQVQNAPRESLRLGNLSMTRLNLDTSTSKFDLSLALLEQAGAMRGAMSYNADLFDQSTIARLAGHFQVLLRSALASPDSPIGSLELLSSEETHQFLHRWNETAAEAPLRASVHGLFEEQARQTPHAVAVEFEGRQLTYAELNARADRLAAHLRSLGVGPEVLVGIYLHRGLDMLVALLGVLKSGGAYVPLDPAFPRERLAFMLADAQASFLLSERALAESRPDHSARVIELDGDWENDTAAATAPADAVGGEHLAYVLYTSGSTGWPKGVEVIHRSVVNFLLSMRGNPGLRAGDGLLAVTTLSFDIAGLELFLPLTVGGRVILLSREAAADGPRLLAQLSRPEVTAMQATPATWQLLLESGWRAGKALKVLCGGEALPRALADRLLERSAEVYNLYGPTETTIWSTLARVGPGDGAVPIGGPIANTQVYLLDERLRLVPLGTSGELYIGGMGVSRGYRQRPALTAERFVPDPFSKTAGARMYRTGDMARWLPDGTIEYLGRTDHQVKVRGFRIELGEIQAALEEHAGIRQAVVVAWEALPGDKRLVAYLAADPAAAPTSQKLQAHLKERLPAYMVPGHFVFLPALPLTPNGKVDRKALPPPDVSTAAHELDGAAPRDFLEVQLVMLWEEVLDRRSIGIHDNFFDLGGHSLLAVRLFARMEAVLGQKLPLRALFDAPTVAQLAELLRHQAGSAPREWPLLVPVQPKGTRPPLFCVARPNVNALGCVFLARALGSDHPLYVLQAQLRTEELAPYTAAEYTAVAADYIREMQAVRPEGPYLLAGFCEGAHIAFEMARQLQAQGKEVALLAVFDAWPVENTRNYFLWRVWQVDRVVRTFFRLGWRERANQVSGAVRAFTKRVFGKLFRYRPSAAPQAQPASPTMAGFVQRYWPGKDFQAPQFGGKIVVFRVPKQPYWRIRDKAMGWGAWARGGVEVHEITGHHGTFLREPHVQVLAEKLQKCIASIATACNGTAGS